MGPAGGGGGNVSPMIIDSVPVGHGKGSGSTSGSGSGRIVNDTTGKKLRLFGVNMECSSSSNANSVGHDNVPIMGDSTSLSSPNFQFLRQSHHHDDYEGHEEQEEEEEEDTSLSSSDQKGKTSVLFDLSPSFKYRH